MSSVEGHGVFERRSTPERYGSTATDRIRTHAARLAPAALPFGVVLLLTFAVTWLCVGLGLSAKSVETASNSPMFLILLPFLGSGFVPTASLPTGMRWFAEYEPFTPVNETLRGLLTGTRIGDNLVITIAWCVGVAVLSYAWSRRLYEREPKPL